MRNKYTIESAGKQIDGEERWIVEVDFGAGVVYLTVWLDRNTGLLRADGTDQRITPSMCYGAKLAVRRMMVRED